MVVGMLKNFLLKPKKICGLEMDRLSVRLFLCKHNSSAVSDIVHASYRLSPGLIENGEIANKEGIKEILHRVKSDHKLAGTPMATLINSREVVTRYLEFPAMSEQNLQKAVLWETEQYLPYTSEEAVIDYVNIGTVNEEKIGVLVGAVPKDIVYEYFNIFKETGLNLVAVDIIPMALKKFLFLIGRDRFGEKMKKEICAVNLGDEIINLVIFKEEKPVFARSLKFSSKKFFDLFLEMRKMLQNETVGNDFFDFIRSENKSDENEIIYFSIQNLVQELVLEVKNSIEFCRAEIALDAAIPVFVLTGSLSTIPGIEEMFKDTFNVSVETGNLNEIPAEMALAAGLSLREG